MRQEPEPGVGQTAAELVAWVGSLPGFTRSAPTDVTLGGRSGLCYDLTVSADASLCQGESKVFVSDDPGFWWGLSPTLKDRVYALEVDGGGNIFIILQASVAGFDAFAATAEPIVATFEFTP